MPRPPSDLNPGASPLALFGSELRRHRERVGWTQDQLGDRIGYEGSYVGHLERGQRRCHRDFAMKADAAMETHDALTNLWDKTVKSNVFPSWFVDWPAREKRSTTIRSFQLNVIDGLLQTPDYARALLRDDAAVEARLTRQNILAPEVGAGPLLVCVLDESVLHRQIGSREVMRDQLEHLVKMSSDRVSIQIVRSDAHVEVNGSFDLATLDDRSEIAYVDTGARGLIMGDPADLRTLSESFEMIRNRALPVDQSIEFIKRTAEERWT
jgi:transcriptional regulator with XRE-family HTH domain